jgi:signal transduction histidine kinase
LFKGKEKTCGACERVLDVTSMKERLKLVGGELFIESQSTRGTTVLARAPVR